ncbi:MAG: RHS repeat protein [Lysobacter sp.]|nr:MAG: RHS repeat protein [Lysobacter sp.]
MISVRHRTRRILIMNACRRVSARSFSVRILFFAFLFALWSVPAPAEAAQSARYFDPVCRNSDCDQATAYSECMDELSLAKADPGLQPWVQDVICHHRTAPYIHPQFHLYYPGAGESWYLNDYQNAFNYVSDPDFEQPGPNLGPKCGNQTFADPINAATCNKYETETLYVGQGSFPLSLSLTYNNQRSYAYYAPSFKTFGRNRTYSYLRRVSYFSTTDGPVVYVSRPDGSALRFLASGSDWVSDRLGVGKLVSFTNAGNITGWQFEDDIGQKEVFDVDGRLIELYDSAGFKQTLSYDGSNRLISVVDPQGRSLGFEYGANGLVNKVNLPDGTFLAFAYTGGKDLQQVDYPGGTNTQYLYDETAYVQPFTPLGSMTGVIDESAQRYSTTTYAKSPFSNKANATSTFLAGGVDLQSATYQMSPNENYATSATITTALGATRQIAFARVKDTVLPTSSSVSCSGCVTSTATFTYDANGQRDVITKNGVATDYDHNARGLESQRIEAANDTTGKKRTIQTDWDPSFRSPTERRVLDSTGALKAKANWSYNARNQVSTTTATDPSVVPNATRTTAYTYCEQADVTAGTCPFVGLLKSIDGPLASTPNDLTTYAYRQTDAAACATAPTTCEYRKGDLWKVTNALSQTVEVLKYDGAGRVLSVKDINDVITDFEYHPRGWLTARKVRGTDNAVETDDQVTSIEYWPTGLVKKVTQPDGAFTSYTYDAAHRLTGIADNAGNTIAYTLNAVGERTQEDTKDSTGTLMRTLSRTYNTLGQLQTATDAYSRNTGFTYDANGNLDQTTDALTRVADNNYDPLDRLSRTLQDMNGIAAETKFVYDALDNLTQVNDPKGLNTDYTYNGFSELKTLVSPDTGTTQYTYDAAGNRASQTDARGKVTNYGYDALNRLTTVTYPTAAALNVAYTYDTPQADCLAGETFTKGRVSKIADQSGTTVYCYDRFGQLVRKKQTVNAKVFTLRYVYLTNGRLDKIVYPDLSEARCLYDTQGRPKEVNVMTATGTVVQVLRDATYYPFGPANQWTYGNGRLMRRSLNQNYQPGFVEVTGGTGISIGYEFDEVGNLKKLRAATQTDPPQRIYTYDGLNRLTENRNGSTNALLHGYAYDKTGNRTSATVGASTTTYTYPATNHRLGQVGANARAYDNNGNTTQIPGTTTKNFVYGDNNRMTQVLNGATVAMNYVHNGKGELVRKYVGTTNTYSLYDEAGHWLGDYNNSGAPTQQVIWFGDLPVGVLVGATTAQKLHYVEADALGTPRAVVDPTRGTQGTAVWTWNLNGEPFGTTAPSQNPDGDATSLVFNMRFPGQRYDSASGLNYNYFRDYEPGTGRYSQSDPIGLAGGASTYGYVSANPLVRTDKLGLVDIMLELYAAGQIDEMPERRNCDADLFLQKTWNQFLETNQSVPGSLAPPGLGIVSAGRVAQTMGVPTLMEATVGRGLANYAHFAAGTVQPPVNWVGVARGMGANYLYITGAWETGLFIGSGINVGINYAQTGVPEVVEDECGCRVVGGK